MIQLINAAETYELRLKILRPNKALSFVKFPDDFSSGSFHLGKFVDNKLVGIASMAIKNFPFEDLYIDKVSYQLRGMAVDEQFQHQNIGKELIAKAEQIAKILGATAIWCNARKSALDFYLREQYQICSEEFHIEDAGLHFVMRKFLD